ncbi:MAG TPA: tRNA (adenosine(37)-N6)-threonylcarbamoyltransferase complex dimerization subunit type 1 TsaB [Gemmataceae bacterium]|jgi:tRNA threonylcarbamoyladenosine biosynthesis protein TsaB|nr:tRNA (adenosine(37)-N6)-threonylcarbamoyltransferase complex dimerization subunit type 1 TsaB [Gemmataceae bacterium]
MSVFERTLVLETAGRVGQAALAAGPAVVAEARLEEGRKRASDLGSAVERLLKDHGWNARELTAVVVGLGPGSYTGLRVGLASAKALAYATGAAFFGVESFAAWAHAAPAEASELSVISDALKGTVFRRDYRRTPGGWEPAGPLGAATVDEWLAGLRPGAWVSGPFAASLAARLPVGVNVGAAHEPRPADVLAAAQAYPWAVTTDVWTAEPYYLRGSSAEEKARRG